MDTPHADGYRLGQAMALRGSAEPCAVSIPSKYLGGGQPKAWDGWTLAAHEYTDGVLAGYRASKEN